MAVSTTYESKSGSSFLFHSFLCHYDHAACHQPQPSFTSWSRNTFRHPGDVVWRLHFPSAEPLLPGLLFQDSQVSCGNGLVAGTEGTAPKWSSQAPNGKTTLQPERGLTWVQRCQRWSTLKPFSIKTKQNQNLFKPSASKLCTIFTPTKTAVFWGVTAPRLPAGWRCDLQLQFDQFCTRWRLTEAAVHCRAFLGARGTLVIPRAARRAGCCKALHIPEFSGIRSPSVRLAACGAPRCGLFG